MKKLVATVITLPWLKKPNFQSAYIANRTLRPA